MLYFQTLPDIDGNSGQVTRTFVHGEFIHSVDAAEYKNLLARFGQHDVHKSICGAVPTSFPFCK